MRLCCGRGSELRLLSFLERCHAAARIVRCPRLGADHEEANHPRFQVTVYLTETQLGQAVAGRKKAAIEKVCAEALENPKLKEILEELGNSQE